MNTCAVVSVANDEFWPAEGDGTSPAAHLKATAFSCVSGSRLADVALNTRRNDCSNCCAISGIWPQFLIDETLDATVSNVSSAITRRRLDDGPRGIAHEVRRRVSRRRNHFALMGPIVREETQMSFVRVVSAAALAASSPAGRCPRHPQGAVAGRGRLRGEPAEAAVGPHRGGREEQRAPGRRRADRAQRQAGDVRLLRLPRQGSQGGDDQRHHLPHRLDDQADRQRRRHHADGGGQAHARRPGVALYPGLRRHQGRRREEERRRHGRVRAGAADPADDGAGPAAPHVGADLRCGGRQQVQAVLPRHERQRPQPDQRRDGREARQALAGLPAGHDLGIFHVDRRAGPRRRGRLGHAARQVHRGAHHQAAEDGRHRLRGRRRQEAARRQADEGGAQERGALRFPTLPRSSPGGRAAAAWCRRPPTMPASCRCSPTVASSTACG